MAAKTWVTAELITATKLNTLETAAWNAGNVMTTLGDTLYGAASGTATRLAGNTTTTRKFLRQTGDGAASAAPTWDTVTKTDVGLANVENTALSTWAGTSNVTTLGTISTGVWNAGAVTSSGNVKAGDKVYSVNNTFVGHDGTNPTYTGRLSLYAADNASAAFDAVINATQANITSTDLYLQFHSTSGAEGTIAGTATPGLIAYNTFTGSHWSQSDTIPKQRKLKTSRTTGMRSWVYEATLEPGTVLVSTDELCTWPGEVAEHLPKCAVSAEAKSPRVYGVYGGHDRDGDILVLALGGGLVKVCDENGPVENGDFLCAASKPGYAMRCAPEDISVAGFRARQALQGSEGTIACTLLAG